MSISPLNNLSNTYLQSVLGTASQNTPLSNTAGGALSGINWSSLTQPDGGQLSPFAQVLSTLQQLQESNPAQYQQMTQQIATNLQNAAQTAQNNGNTTATAQLSQLANDFTTASKSGQLPNVSDLAQAVGGHHHHHHHSHAALSNPAASEPNSTQNNHFNPIAIIENTLSNAATTTSSGQ